MINWIRTYSGGKFSFIHPKAKQIKLEDIVHSLSRIGRFNCHTKIPYSVLNHLILCHDAAPKEFRREALCHDFSEAFLCDIPSPLKALIPQYKEIEIRVEKVIAKKFKLKFPFPAEVKIVDLTVLCTEQRDLMRGKDYKDSLYKPFKNKIIPFGVEESKKEFYKRYYKLYEV